MEIRVVAPILDSLQRQNIALLDVPAIPTRRQIDHSIITMKGSTDLRNASFDVGDRVIFLRLERLLVRATLASDRRSGVQQNCTILK